MINSYQIMIVAGEPSGDAHAAELVRALREKANATNFEFYGATGVQMREVGVETILNADNFSIVGLPEIARALPMFLKAFRTLKETAVSRKPDAVILVDFPDFNLKFAKSLKKANLKVIYYISPQLWAWRKYRIKSVSRYVDLLLAILPFEKDWYAEQGIEHIEYVGNPLAGRVRAKIGKKEFCIKHNLDFKKPVVALLPGSRHKEIVRILPGMLETASLMSVTNSELQFVIALASASKIPEVESAIKQAGLKHQKLPEILLTVCGETKEAVNAANVAAVTSGTATLETAIIGTPMVIVYKTSAFNYGALRPLIRVPHFGLINLIAGERLAVELIQNEFTSERLSTELFRLLERENNLRMRGRLKEAVETLGETDASARAAAAILSFLQAKESAR